MDNIRLFLWMGLGVLLWLSFQAWQQDYALPPTALDSTGLSSSVLEDSGPVIDDLPSLSELSATESSADMPLSVGNNASADAGKIRRR